MGNGVARLKVETARGLVSRNGTWLAAHHSREHRQREHRHGLGDQRQAAQATRYLKRSVVASTVAATQCYRPLTPPSMGTGSERRRAEFKPNSIINRKPKLAH